MDNFKILDIVAVTYGQNESLKCFINSIKAQTNPNWMLYVIHDGLNDELKADLIKNSYINEKISFIEYPERTGGYGHFLRNWSIFNLIKNEYVLMTNGDNYYTPNAVDAILNKNEDFIYFDCVHSHETAVNHNKSSYGYMNCELAANKIDMGCVAVKTHMSKFVGFSSNSYSADWDYFNSLLNLNPSICKIDKVLFVHN